ncbi:hypothetical protein [Natronorubrum daqingense]|nr:hypothetical protein [Natronorubrum daqingense]SIR60598.1 hypothetical protein SAMN05421809_1601 [Natronorubrum daqingense]
MVTDDQRMTDNGYRNTSFDDHSSIAERLLRVLENFADEFSRRGVPVHLDQIANDGKYLKGKKVGQEPERFVEQFLVWPSLDIFGFDHWAQPYGYPKWDHSTPDFAIKNFQSNIKCAVIGEVKTPNKFEYAEMDIVEYLKSDLGDPTVAFATDGIKWKVYARPAKDDEHKLIASIDLSETFARLPFRYKERESYDTFQTRQAMGDVDVMEKTAIERQATKIL